MSCKFTADPPNRTVVLILISLRPRGIFQCFMVVSNGLFTIANDDGGEDWRASPGARLDFSHWPSEFGQSLRCISHDSRASPDPIRHAVNVGCIGVRADIWLYHGEVLVGSAVQSLDTRNTLKERYLDPLLVALKARNPHENKAPIGIFDEPSRSFLLLLDFRSLPGPLWPHVLEQLSGLRARGFLTHRDGPQLVQRPVTVVVTGRIPLSFVTALDAHRRDIFFDASMDELVLEGKADVAGYSNHRGPRRRSDHDATAGTPNAADIDARKQPPTEANPRYTSVNSFCASANFRESVGLPRRGRFSGHQINLIRQHIQQAHLQGLKARYYSVPDRRNVRDLVWHTLSQEGADLIDVDGLGDRAAGRGWPVNSRVP